MQNITIDWIDTLLCQLPNLTSLEFSSYREIRGFRRFSASKFQFKLEHLCCDIDSGFEDAFGELLAA